MTQTLTVQRQLTCAGVEILLGLGRWRQAADLTLSLPVSPLGLASLSLVLCPVS